MTRAPLVFHSRYTLMVKRPLKVFRTSTGFQDAYVAVTSRKAALEAWGTDKDLFAVGAAELVTDARLTKAALAQPGVVIRMARGTTAQHLAAAGKVRKAAPESEAAKVAAPPKPSRAKLERAEAALERKEQQLSSALADIDAQIQDLRRQRASVRSRLGADIEKLKEDRSRQEQTYRKTLDDWDR